MKVILAEKPSVAREIARILGADSKKEGYIEGDGVAVTWAFGHLVQLSMPDGYGVQGFRQDNLPILPPVFSLIVRQEKSDNGYQPNSRAVAQLKVIKSLFDRCSKIIVATDAGREGELIFRYIYEFLGCAKPFDRLWISSLTDRAIEEGLDNLRRGAEFDNLYYAARARSQADWIVGINATQAISIAAGRGTYSLGRVQTPTLAMVCARYWERRNFTPERVWQMHVGVSHNSQHFSFTSAEKCKDKSIASEMYDAMYGDNYVTITDVEKKESRQEPPYLYDLTTLQKDANRLFGFTAEQTLSIAQSLYENKLITYPRTGSRYISEDVFEHIPSLLAAAKANTSIGKGVRLPAELSLRSVDGGKVTDHHALLITGAKPAKKCTEQMATIYDMIAGRMLEAFSDTCIKDVTMVTATCGGITFNTKGSILRQVGWRAFLSERDEDIILPDWSEGDRLFVSGFSQTEGMTKAKPLHSEATLLAAMESAGKELEGEAERLAMKETGIGTPATRASIIETLIDRGYIERVGKVLSPTEKGLAMYSVVKSMSIANVEMTGQWEAELALIERGELRDSLFHRGIEEYTREVVAELMSSRMLFPTAVSCPRCGDGRVNLYGKATKCSNPICGLIIYKQVAGKMLTMEQFTSLIKERKTELIKGFTSRSGYKFDASLAFDADYKVVFVFPDKKTKTKSKKRR